MFNFFGFCTVVASISLALGLAACGDSGQCDPNLPDPYGVCQTSPTPTASVTPAPAGDDDATVTATPPAGDDDSGAMSPTPPPATPAPTATPVPTPVDISVQQACWDSVPFEIQNRYIDRGVAELVSADWVSGLQWVDTDFVQILDGSESTNALTLKKPDEHQGCTGSVEGELYFPEGYVMPSFGEEYNNGIAASLQPDGTVLEVSYLWRCSNGEWEGYILPDSAPLDACAEGIDSSRYLGAHGGSHFTATQAIRVGELTGSTPIGRPLPIEVDHTHLYYSASESDGRPGWRWPAASADGDAASEYSGAISDLQMGSILVLPQSFDCSIMQTTPSGRLCEVGRDHGFVIVDDSDGEDEVAFPIEPTAEQEVEDETGIVLHNATGAYADNVETMMTAIMVLTNPEAAWVKAAN